jgi:hypothetical protein
MLSIPTNPLLPNVLVICAYEWINYTKGEAKGFPAVKGPVFQGRNYNLAILLTQDLSSRIDADDRLIWTNSHPPTINSGLNENTII